MFATTDIATAMAVIHVGTRVNGRDGTDRRRHPDGVEHRSRVARKPRRGVVPG